jgi:polar amino acid transport system permease protein
VIDFLLAGLGRLVHALQQIQYFYFNLEVARTYLVPMLKGFLVTVEMAALIILFGFALGLVLAVIRTLRIRALNVLLLIYVDIFRAVPQLMIIVFAYFALPYAGVSLSSFWAATISLSLILAAFNEEIFWAGFTSIARGQWEAARSTGLGFLQSLRYVVLPQAIRMAIPPLTNRTIAITKGTSLASVVAVEEIIKTATHSVALAANPTPLMMGAILYLILFAPLVRVSRWTESRFASWSR